MTASDLPLKRLGRGKVRDIYEVDADRLLLVATDRISAFDVVMAQAIPFKGAVLTQISAWWFDRLKDVVAHHMISAAADDIIAALPISNRIVPPSPDAPCCAGARKSSRSNA